MLAQFFATTIWRAGRLYERLSRDKRTIHREGSMNCDMKARLTIEYEATTTVFSEAVTELKRNIGISTKEEYDRLSRIANDARVKSERARLALEQHIAEHRC
jgi:hypothetical protein